MKNKSLGEWEMKKIIISLMIVLLLIMNVQFVKESYATFVEHENSNVNDISLVDTNQNLFQKQTEMTYMIPEEAIRLRILANSDSDGDQRMKQLVRDEVYTFIHESIQTFDNIDLARLTIAKNLPKIEKIVEQTLAENGVSDTFNVFFRKKVVFPHKTYGSFVYPAGEYEAILITIGEGKGENWWCVLFPPLCFIDFFNEVAVVDTENEHDVDENMEETEEKGLFEVKFFLFEFLGIS